MIDFYENFLSFQLVVLIHNLDEFEDEDVTLSLCFSADKTSDLE